MKYKHGTRRRALVYEKELVEYWKKNQTFEKSIDIRPVDNPFVFYDGPPFLTGTPHHGHLLISTVKDLIARYKTMQGFRVERRWGWDCHGLPAEVYVEGQLGIKNKKEIGTKISISDYVKACRAAMVKTGTEWEDTVERIGRWVEFKGAYKTMDNEYMESVWWAFKKLYEEGKIYEGEKILIYCTKDATPISKSEVAMENSYQMDTDPSVYVFFKLEDSDEFLLAWTTTPWTLPANVAVAVHPEIEYSLVEYGDKKFYVASAAVERVLVDEKRQPYQYNVLKTVKGTELIGKKYHPLFENRGPESHRVLAADFVTASDGTGIVHEAPAYGEEDYELCKKEGIPVVSIVDANGHYTEGHWQGQNIWEVNKEIAKWLVSEGRALKVEYIRHEYPHCHRCGEKLMYRAHPSWFLDIQGQKSEMLAENRNTNWVPKHLKTGRFNNILETAPDWNLSRDRYWATPIPVWRGVQNDGTEVIKVIGSFEEFTELTGKKLDDYHLPKVMDVEFEVDGVVVKHVGKVLDCWFESGSMPFAQFHYPFENKEVFERSYPADFITEAIDQTRGWFYALMAVNVGLFGKAPFKNVISTGHINAADGKKLSKKLKNYTPPMELMDKVSADSFRFLMLSSPLTSGESFALSDKDVINTARKLTMVWNMYDFFTMYAEVDNWQWDGMTELPLESLNSPLDIWIVSRVHETTVSVMDSLDAYNIAESTKPILDLIEDASNWYVRRSRRRFWKSEDDQDKDQAYRTLQYVLYRLALILAPYTPFLAEELYRLLTNGESVHVLNWPKTNPINKTNLESMARTRSIIEQGLGLRMKSGENEQSIKVRQVLSSLHYGGERLGNELEQIIAEEVNVKQVINDPSLGAQDVSIDKVLTPELIAEGHMREVIRIVQNARKEAQLQVDDRIELIIHTKVDELAQAMLSHKTEIATEVLAVEFELTDNLLANGIEATVNDLRFEFTLKKAKN